MIDLLVFGKIYTMDDASPIVEAIGVKKGKIVYAGAKEGAVSLNAKQCLDFGPRTILPGFIDTHVHVIPAGIFMNGANLAKVANISDVLETLRAHTKKTGGKGWVLGAYFQDKLIEEKRFPTRDELDSVTSTQPLLICHNDLHPLALNSKAIELLKLDPQKEGVQTDEEGRPTGIVEDPACVDMLGDILAKMGIASILNGILLVDDYAAAHGVTTVFGKDVDAVLTLRNLAKEMFKVEFVPMWYSDGCKNLESLQKFLGNKSMKNACICAFADGAFDGHSAALGAPYSDQPGNCGILNYTDEEMYAFTMMAHKEGRQVSFHAIGDAAIDQVLRVYERVLEECPRDDHRLRIEHFEEPYKKAIKKAASLNVALSMQPLLIEVCERMDFSGYRPFIGNRVKRCSPYRSILDAGILVGGGTDYPVTPMDVLHGAAIAMSHPVESERITLDEYLRMNTVEAAKLGFLEDRKGKLAVGMDADFIVLESDPYLTPVEKLSEIRLKRTFAKGKPIYSSGGPTIKRNASLPTLLIQLIRKKARRLFGA